MGLAARELLIDLAEILKVLPPTLEVLRLNRTACFGDGTKQEWKHLTRLELVDVERSGVKGTMEDIQHAIFKSRQGVVEDPKPCEVVTTLRLSHLCKACALCCAKRCCRFFWLFVPEYSSYECFEARASVSFDNAAVGFGQR